MEAMLRGRAKDNFVTHRFGVIPPGLPVGPWCDHRRKGSIRGKTTPQHSGVELTLAHPDPFHTAAKGEANLPSNTPVAGLETLKLSI